MKLAAPEIVAAGLGLAHVKFEQADIEQATRAILPELIDRTRQLAEPSLHARQQASTLRRQSHRAAMPNEQGGFEKFFERLDVGADRGRGHVERMRRTRETQMRRDGLEGAQGVKG